MCSTSLNGLEAGELLSRCAGVEQIIMHLVMTGYIDRRVLQYRTGFVRWVVFKHVEVVGDSAMGIPRLF